MIFPDYERSILSTVSSLMRHYGLRSAYPALPELDALLSKRPKHVALVIIDGAGVKPMEASLPAGSFLRSGIRAQVTSVFPSTTTAACSAYYNGLSPLEHGWLGWQLYFKEYASDIAIFRNRTYYTEREVAGPEVGPALMPFETIIEKIRSAYPSVKTFTQYAFPNYAEKGAHVNIRISDFQGLCANLKKICAGDSETFSISYWGEPDYTMHRYGAGSAQATAKFREINAGLESLYQALSDTLLIVTADHGMINSEGIDITSMPDLMECLVMPPMIEARAAAFYVKSHKRADFERIFSERLGEYFTLMNRDEVYSSGIFGKGVPNPKFDDLIGDYIACATGKKHILYSIPGYSTSPFVGLHAGLTEDEMLVPVIAYRK